MKEVSISKIDKIIKNAALPATAEIVLHAGDEEIPVTVTLRLSVAERTDMINEIADMVFPVGRDAIYIPSFEEAAQVYAFFNHFTNIRLSAGSQKLMDLNAATSLVECVNKMSGGLVTSVFDEANKLIEYRKECAAHSKDTMDAMQDLISAVNSLVHAATQDANVPLDDVLKAVAQISDVDKDELIKAVVRNRAKKSEESTAGTSAPKSSGVIELVTSDLKG